MADPASYRPRAGEIPTGPGVYRFSDADGRVIYVGKAKNLRNRLNSYFHDVSSLHFRTQTMVLSAVKVEWTLVANELEALQLEWTWINQFNPHFNVVFKDDKSYPWVAITWSKEYPRVFVGRGARRKGTRYFGPYQAAWAIRQTVDVLLTAYPMRSCTSGVFRSAQSSGRQCLLGDIGKCAAPCIGRIDAQEHRELAMKMSTFLSGKVASLISEAEQQMNACAQTMDYERAARWRDRLTAIQIASAKNAIVFPDGTDADVIALAKDELEVAVAIFHVRDGRVIGERGWVADRADDADTATLLESFLLYHYAEAESHPNEGYETIPSQVLVPAHPASGEVLADLLSERRGAKVTIRVPQRGDKRTLLETVAKNAANNLALHKARRASDLTVRSKALEEIQEALGLAEAPLRIECYDISHTQGNQVVGSMVVFEDGLAKKSDYRRFIIKSFEGSNDVAAMHEVLSRRFTHKEESDGKPRFAYRPALVVVDGGAPQVAAAAAAFADIGVEGVALCGLAKRLEELWVPGEEYPVILPRNSQGLYLLQRIRDEAHRFAITHHRSRRSKSMLESTLDMIPGLGPTRVKALRKHFGSFKALRAANAEELAQVDGIGPKMAELIAASLDAESPRQAVNVMTGEVSDIG